MRPLELRVRNFRSYYGEDAVFDFRGRGLIGIVGPIGSGKSSLLDAIAFALFGRTPSVGAATKALIHQRSDGAVVSLRFSIDSEVWEVTRALRRKGQSQHGLFRLSADEAQPTKVESLVLETEVNARIVELLGLEFEGFSRSIMLAQGRFAEFLQSRPAERDGVLKGVFGHDRIDTMRTLARERAAALGQEVDSLSAQLEAADALSDRIAERRERLVDAEARLELLRKAEPRFVEFAQRTESTTRVIAHAEARLAELHPLAGQLPAAEVVAQVVGVAKTANDTRQRLGATLTEAQSQIVVADDALVALDPVGLRQRLEQAARLEATLDQITLQQAAAVRAEAGLDEKLAIAGAALGEEEQRAQQQDEADGAARRLVAEAITAHDAATARLHRARHDNMAAVLRDELVVGEACPVCAQELADLPPSVVTPATEHAEEALAEATAALKQSRESSSAATSSAAAGKEALANVRVSHEGLRKELTAAAAVGAGLAAESSRLAVEIAATYQGEAPAEVRQRLGATEQGVTEARKRLDLARSEHDEAILAAQNADKELGGLRLVLTEFASRLDIDVNASGDVDAVAAEVGHARAQWADVVDTLDTAKTAAEHERSEIAAAARLLREELATDDDFAKYLVGFAASTDVRREQISTDEEELNKSADLQAARMAAAKARDVFQRLSGDLTDSKFVRYLLDEEKRDLALLGSEHFQRLSQGRYRFSADGDFAIVDLTAADAVRKADSLSGGETFLASLALALALAEMIARTGGRLDAFFLDEGFGNLDAEHLDLAMEGIEQLAAGAGDRLVLVVSHVPDMRDRLEDLIVLDRSPVTGDTIVEL